MSTEAQRLLERSKRSERRLGKWLIENDGPDPLLKPGEGIVSSTGRVGHITELQYDCHSLHYAAENKNIEVWAGLWGFWKKVFDKATDRGKTPLLVFDYSNEDGYVNGKKVARLHVISEERHAELLGYERHFNEQVKALKPADGTVRSYSKEEQVKRGKGRGKAKAA